nr:response regulator [Methylomarinum vadi]
MRKKINVLIVDHSRLFRTILSDVLQRHGYTSFFCSSGAEALSQLRIQQYDLVCAPYHLSDMSGKNLCQQVRAIRHCQETRIILFTAEENENLLKQALLAGATDIYSKQQFAQFEVYLQRLAEDLFNNVIGQVLLIEDSPSQLLWLERLLKERGLEVDAYSNAERALAAFEENTYDLVVTDIVLEGSMSGLTLVREIRRNPTDKGLTPVFAISAYDDISRRIELYHIGVNDYMTKPVIAEEFVYRTANLIRNQRIVNELNAERQHLQEIALLDPVTGLYNRNAFDKLAPKELATAFRNQCPLSLAILDIDYFKKINDTHGHDIGDRVLADVGFWLRNILRKGDLVFRWGVRSSSSSC